ncbi:MAG: Mut7-C RNAse domain-containing protein [Candidatus Cloacimonetes bacterium]|nr:Mut7-C RNAse domain-containing protein [Candidatus Cloacimonadota bacterium]
MKQKLLLPRFLLRENLSKLARNLRFLGYDSAIYKQISFDNFKRIAARDKRIILTRSHQEAHAKSDLKIILINSDQVDEQVQEISSILKFDPVFIFSRCSLCNKILYEIAKEKIINSVPEYVLTHHSHFRICRFCGHIYWEGDHYQAIHRRMKNLVEDGKS